MTHTTKQISIAKKGTTTVLRACKKGKQQQNQSKHIKQSSKYENTYFMISQWLELLFIEIILKYTLLRITFI